MAAYVPETGYWPAVVPSPARRKGRVSAGEWAEVRAKLRALTG